MTKQIEIPVIEVHQNKGDFLVGVMKARDLYSLAQADRMRLEALEVPKYAGIQRPLDHARVEQIRDYLETPTSNFPNAIVVTLDSHYILEWPDGDDPASRTSRIIVEKADNVMTIIDGQHRAAALDAADDDFEVIVSIFLDLAEIDCAEIFAKINSTQKKVNASIAFQLFGYSRHRSPQRTAHDVAYQMNKTPGSPFHRRILMMGKKDAFCTDGYLSQSAFCKGIMSLYARSPEKDQNALAKGKPLEMYGGFPLRRWFIEASDENILETVWIYFYHVASVWQDQWYDKGGTSILAKTTGFNALVQVLKKYLILLSRRNDSGLTREEVRKGLEDLKKSMDEVRDKYEGADFRFVRANWPAGNQGVVKLRDRLLEDLGINGASTKR